MFAGEDFFQTSSYPQPEELNGPQLHYRNLTPTLPDTLDPQPSFLHNIFELIWRSLDPIDDPHHAQIALVAKAYGRPIVC